MSRVERDCGMQAELRKTAPRGVPWNWLELEALAAGEGNCPRGNDGIVSRGQLSDPGVFSLSEQRDLSVGFGQ